MLIATSRPPGRFLPWGDGDPPRASSVERDALVAAKNLSYSWAASPSHDIPYRFVYHGKFHTQFRVRFRLFKCARDKDGQGHYVSMPGGFRTADLAARAACFFLRSVYGPGWWSAPVPAFSPIWRLRSPAWADPAPDVPGRWQAKALLGGTGRFRPVDSPGRDGYFGGAAEARAAAKMWWLAGAAGARLIAGPCGGRDGSRFRSPPAQ